MSGHPLRREVAYEQALTGRQKQILDLLCENMTSRQAGAALGICPRTVDNHCVRICRVLGVTDRFEAVRVWRRQQDLGRETACQEH